MRPIKTISLLMLSLILIACGYAPRYKTVEEARAQGARIPRGVTIDGVAVGKMTIAQARTALEEELGDRRERTVFTVVCSSGRVKFDASKLPISWNIDETLLAAANLSQIGLGNRELKCVMRLHGEACRSSLSELCAPLNAKAKDAKAVYRGGVFQYTGEQTGSEIDLLRLSGDVTAALEKGGEIKAELLAIAPGYTIEQAKADTARLSSFSTSFAGGVYGKKDRVYNIKKAARAIDGVCVLPGEEFNMNRELGARNKENGWREAAAIRDGAYVEEYGGGVCQVSTTLYNAVLLARLSVTERHHHSWPLGYVDIGRDATISTGGPNFRFINDTDKPVYISALVDEKNKSIAVRLFGAPPADGLSAKLRSKKTQHIADPGSRLVVDSSLEYGTLIVEREARSGSVSETARLLYDAEGTLVARELISKDKYRPITGIIRVSPDQKQRARQSYAISKG